MDRTGYLVMVEAILRADIEAFLTKRAQTVESILKRLRV